MGKATGIFLILAGIGTAALVLPSVDQDAERQLAEVVYLATGAVRPQALERAPVSGPAVAAIPRLATGSLTTGSLNVRTASQTDRSGTATLNSAVATIGAAPAPVLVAPPQAVVKSTVVGSAHQPDAQARQRLTKDIQRELKRVGCYEGEISGDWTAPTRQAMKAFVDRVNASLPVDEPDHILRTMVQGHPGNACGLGCPTGQSANQGRCRPTGIMAQAPLPRMADARPRDLVPTPRDTAPARPSVPRPAWETTVALAPPEPLDLDGRMAIGAATAPAAIQPSFKPVSNGTPIELAPLAATASRHGLGSRAAASGLAGIIVPGAIAAFSGQSARVAEAGTGPRTPNAGNGTLERAADKSVTATDRSGAAVSAPQRERPRQRVYRAPPAEKFRFPPPSYVGAREHKYLREYKKSPFENFFKKLFQSP